VLAVDWRTHLLSVADQSLGAIFAAQFVEHLTSEQLFEFVRLCAAKVRRGGVIVLETLTPCLNTLLEKFWVDPTHTSPVNPDALSFLVGCAGFKDVEVEYYNDSGKRLQRVATAGGRVMNRNMEMLNALLYAPHYYAVIGRRQGDA